ncbi:MAG: DUF924 family protein [Pseudomonadota bacterium]
MDEIGAILSFWIDTVGEDGWYTPVAAVDEDCRARFLALWEKARAGGLTDWGATPGGALAYLILTDQFPRNMFRGDPRSFATDAAARAMATGAIAAGHDLRIPEPQRQFFYLPFEHSEDPADQDRSVALMRDRLTDRENRLHAEAHREIIRIFGRFPFRNAALGRNTTPAERAFIDEGGYGAMVRKVKARHEDSA